MEVVKGELHRLCKLNQLVIFFSLKNIALRSHNQSIDSEMMKRGNSTKMYGSPEVIRAHAREYPFSVIAAPL